ncbi:MAG TPA: T9SS type A sorting domain-containing protein, partial [Saprospiraceae bacterium]|nr:T9SS type A sorting domain-containing protein [Saprospiraceae bacterium]
SVYFEHGTIHVYPNPTHGTIFIQSNNFSIDKILIYNQLGQLVFTSNDTGNTLDISLLPKGLYTVMVQSKSELLKQLVILE